MELKLGKVFGAPIILTENLMIYALVICGFTAFQSGIQSALMALLAIVSIGACVLLHEIGHLAAGKHYGIRPINISLNFFGGIASSEAQDWYRLMDQPKKAMVVWVCGPLVNAVIYGVLTIAMLALAPYPTLVADIAWLRFFNLAMMIFNLLPIYPLDGGGIFYSILRCWTTKAKAIRVASIVGMIGAVAILIAAIQYRAIVAGLIAIVIFLNARAAPKSPLFK